MVLLLLFSLFSVCVLERSLWPLLPIDDEPVPPIDELEPVVSEEPIDPVVSEEPVEPIVSDAPPEDDVLPVLSSELFLCFFVLFFLCFLVVLVVVVVDELSPGEPPPELAAAPLPPAEPEVPAEPLCANAGAAASAKRDATNTLSLRMFVLSLVRV